MSAPVDKASLNYDEGFVRGEKWALQDIDARLAHASDSIELFRAEADTTHRWQRAFYLGALRGYRSIARTLGRDGRWGT